jgi:hypothetical protein
MLPAPVSVAADGERLEIAFRTLIRGSAFLAASLQARATGGRGGSDVLAGPGGARVIGNGLRELDRFLCLLLDEAVRCIAPEGFDHTSYARRTNAAAKVRHFHVAAGLTGGDDERLRAIGRVRACLHHCRGIVHDPAVYRDLQAATTAPGGEDPGEERLKITFDDLARICEFYAESAVVLMGICRPDFPIP